MTSISEHQITPQTSLAGNNTGSASGNPQTSQPPHNQRGQYLNPNASNFAPVLPRTAPITSVEISTEVKNQLSHLVNAAPPELRYIARDVRGLARELQSGRADPATVNTKLTGFAVYAEGLARLMEECGVALAQDGRAHEGERR